MLKIKTLFKSLHSSNTKLTQKTKSGFTIVELTITMAFVAVLLITITIITINISSIYQKGLTLKAVNSVGRSLVDELTMAINSAPSVDTRSLCKGFLSDDTEVNECIKQNAMLYIFQDNGPADYGVSNSDYDNTENLQYNGIFCTGRYSYFWNTYYGDEAGKTISVRYRNENGGEETLTREPGNDIPFRLVRFEDRNYRLCSATLESGKYKTKFSSFSEGNPIDMTNLANTPGDTATHPYPVAKPEEGLLDAFDLDLMLYNLNIFPISQDSVTLRTFMTGTFVLGTLRGSVDITRSGDYCQEDILPGATDHNGTEDGYAGSSGNIFDTGAEFNYCAINKFNFATRTAGAK